MTPRCALSLRFVGNILAFACIAWLASASAHAQQDTMRGLRLGAGIGLLTFDSAAGLSGPSIEIDATVQRTNGFARIRFRYHHIIAPDSSIAYARLARGVLSSTIEAGWYVLSGDADLRPFGAIGVGAFAYREEREGRISLGGPPEHWTYRLAPHAAFGADYRLSPTTVAVFSGTLAYIIEPHSPFHWVGGISAGLSISMAEL